MKILIYFLLAFATGTVYAQRECATYDYVQKNGHIPTIAGKTSSAVRDTAPNEVIIIPVIIHVLYYNNTQNISDQQVLSQLDVLNQDYRHTNVDAANTPAAFKQLAGDARIKFCLAHTDPQGRPTSGIIHKHTNEEYWLADDAMKYSAAGGDNAWDATKYLNIWVCGLFGRNLGYATPPGGPADKDGVVIQYDVFGTGATTRYPFNKGRTATHEIGHWLGLKHLWGDASCGDDGIYDTPPQQSYNNGCPSFPHTSSCSINANGDLFMNFMDFSDDGCMNMFTHGQVNKMRSYFAAGGLRNSFLASTACDSSKLEAGPLPTDTTSIPVKISIYPSPATDHINITAKGFDLNGKIARVFNVVGNELISQTLQAQGNTIALNKLTSGIYFIKIEGDRKPIKFIKL